MGDVTHSSVPSEHQPEADTLTQRLQADGWARHVTVDRLLQAWEQLAREVGDYALTIDDYTNDLTGRDALEQVMEWASPTLAAVLHERLSAADQRFRSATSDDGGIAVGRYFRIGQHPAWWWWRRRPTTGRLGSYLENT